MCFSVTKNSVSVHENSQYVGDVWSSVILMVMNKLWTVINQTCIKMALKWLDGTPLPHLVYAYMNMQIVPALVSTHPSAARLQLEHTFHSAHHKNTYLCLFCVLLASLCYTVAKMLAGHRINSAIHVWKLKPFKLYRVVNKLMYQNGHIYSLQHQKHNSNKWWWWWKAPQDLKT